MCKDKPFYVILFFITEGGKDDILYNKALDKNPSFIRLRLSQRVLELQEAVSVTSRKVKLQWEVSCEEYSVFRGFSKAKFANGGSILTSSQFLILPQLPQKMTLASKVVKIDPKIIVLLPKI
jgi:hypothetical protein